MASVQENVLSRVRAIPADMYRYLVFDVLVLLMLYFAGLDSYLLSHGLAELFSVVIMMLSFVIAWNAREYLNNNYLLFLGISLVSVSSVDLYHTLFYGAMGVPVGDTSQNVSSQLWIAARYLQAGSLLAAPFFIGKKLKADSTLMAYAAVTSIVLLSISYWHSFPVSYISGVGQTSFAQTSGIIIGAMFLLSLALLVKKRQNFEKNVFYLLCSFIVITIISEMFFTLYAGVYDSFNLAGNLLKIIASYLLYRAVAAASFKDPHKLLLKSIENKEAELRVALENSRMRESEMAALFQSSREALEHNRFEDSVETISNACKRVLGAHYGYAILFGKGEAEEFVYCDATIKKDVADLAQSEQVKELATGVRYAGKASSKNNFAFTLNNRDRGLLKTRIVIRNILFAPLTIHSETVGLLAFANKKDGFTRNDERVAGTFGKIASLVLHNQWTVDELKANEQKFRSVTESSKSAFLTLDGAGRIVYWNKSAEHIFGYPEEEILNKPFKTLALKRLAVTEDAELNAEETTEPEVRELPDVGDRSVEMRGRRKNGEDFPLEISSSSWEFGREKFYTSIIRDITERKDSERTLKDYAWKMEEGKARDDALLLSIADGILVTDTAGNITYVNKALERMCGMSSTELLGRDLDETIPLYDELDKKVPKERRPIYIGLDPAKHKELPISTSTAFHLVNKRDKRKIPLSINAAPFVIDNKITGAVVVWRDITQEKEIDKAKSEFISFASHQLRTPLTSISLSIEMLLHHIGGTLDKEQKKYLRIAFNGMKDMTDIIETLLNISRIQMGTLIVNTEPTDLAKFSDKILENVSISIKSRKIAIKRMYDKKMPPIKIDQRLMKIVLENLISNAMKYSPVKSTILVEIRKRGKDAVFAISDTGDGIPRDQQTRIFEKLFRVQVDGKVKGTGLGLYMVKAAVDQYGGKVWCESPSPRAFNNPNGPAKERGTTFYVTVPLAGMNAKNGTTD